VNVVSYVVWLGNQVQMHFHARLNPRGIVRLQPTLVPQRVTGRSSSGSDNLKSPATLL
jgi:hypothetical protein